MCGSRVPSMLRLGPFMIRTGLLMVSSGRRRIHGSSAPSVACGPAGRAAGTGWRWATRRRRECPRAGHRSATTGAGRHGPASRRRVRASVASWSAGGGSRGASQIWKVPRNFGSARLMSSSELLERNTCSASTMMCALGRSAVRTTWRASAKVLTGPERHELDVDGDVVVAGEVADLGHALGDDGEIGAIAADAEARGSDRSAHAPASAGSRRRALSPTGRSARCT